MSESEIIKEFLIESHENLDRLDQDLIALEKDPGDRETLASIFRTIHTIKGTSGFLAFNQLEALTHAGESLLSRLRDGLLALSPAITTALLAMVDAVRQMLGNIEEEGKERERDDRELIATLTRLQTGEPAVPTAPSDDAGDVPEPEPPAPANLGDILISRQVASPGHIQEAVEQQQAGDPRHIGEILVEKGVVKPRDVVDALNIQQQARGQSASDSTIRVDVSLLDRLMNRVGELVLLRNQIVQYTNSSEDGGLLATSQRLNLITTELQESVMKTRMQPIGNVWGKFPRTVRDVALACGKQVQIEMEGSETELDKTIIEAIKDPLTHLVRNAVDHGIEAPAERQAAGKDVVGSLFLRAFHEGGQVNIEITDDGAGLNYDKIRSKAVQKALVSADQAARLSEREVCNLIFLPGFSTAEKITNVSGRGVGLDVVKTKIEKIGGVVDVQSKPGQGTTVRMKIPLTLAIIPALVVTSAGDRYAIPQVNLLELVRLEGEQARKGIELVHGAPVHRLRGRLLPLVYLNRELQVQTSAPSEAAELPGTSPADSVRDNGSQDTTAPEAGKLHDFQGVNIVVLHADDRQFGLVVDEINDTEEIVVKPLSKQLKSINAYAGATIMGDGRVALILDVLGLAQRAKVVGEVRDRAVAEHEQNQSSADISIDGGKTVLLFQSGGRERMAIELSQVARLEEFAPEAIEITGGRRVVQYRGHIMPLLAVTELLGAPSCNPDQAEAGRAQVVVYTASGISVGLVIDRILDIVEERFEIQPDTARPGVLGSAVIQKRSTEILDIPTLLAGAPGAQVAHALSQAAHA